MKPAPMVDVEDQLDDLFLKACELQDAARALAFITDQYDDFKEGPGASDIVSGVAVLLTCHAEEANKLSGEIDALREVVRAAKGGTR
jgi:hypothetical protein